MLQMIPTRWYYNIFSLLLCVQATYLKYASEGQLTNMVKEKTCFKISLSLDWNQFSYFCTLEYRVWRNESVYPIFRPWDWVHHQGSSVELLLVKRKTPLYRYVCKKLYRKLTLLLRLFFMYKRRVSFTKK